MVEMKHVHEASWSLGAKTLTGHLDLSVKKKTGRVRGRLFYGRRRFFTVCIQQYSPSRSENYAGDALALCNSHP